MFNAKKTVSAVKNLGCSIEELKNYIQSKFTPEMTWDNYGSYWHIDHIRPLASFDLSDKAQAILANNFANLQPLQAIENFKKGAKCLT
jgi:hypothetical protein